MEKIICCKRCFAENPEWQNDVFHEAGEYLCSKHQTMGSDVRSPRLSMGYRPDLKNNEIMLMDASGRLIVKLCDCKRCQNKKSLKELLDDGYEILIKK